MMEGQTVGGPMSVMQCTSGPQLDTEQADVGRCMWGATDKCCTQSLKPMELAAERWWRRAMEDTDMYAVS